ncbi:MAG: branched-chain amino acid ABC transporter permease, partial [Cyclobacteriaceae bacterium]|nr:branched-chain amino acid ABC transporter permease [Cyclobacteriaceae bacterium]
HKTLYKQIIYFVLFLLIIFIPYMVKDEYLMQIIVLTIILAVFALSYDLIIGYTGQLSMGHQAFFGLGAYLTAIFGKTFGFDPWLCLPVVIIGNGLLGLAIGAISLRTRGAFLAIITLGFAMILWMIAMGWREITKGMMGISSIPHLTISIPFLSKVEFDSPYSFFYLAITLLFFTVFLLQRLLSSRFGTALKALRENEERAISVGINAFRYYLAAFTIASILAGLAGFAYAEFILQVSPIVLSISYLEMGLIMVIVGGSGVLQGPILGAVVLAFLPEMLRISEEFRFILFGIILIVFIVFMPQGIYPNITKFGNRFIFKRKTK